MNGIVARQALADQPLQRIADQDLVRKCELILYGDMKGGVRQEVRQRDSCAAMKSSDQINSFAFVEREPLIRDRCIGWIVTLHSYACDGQRSGERRAATLAPKKKASAGASARPLGWRMDVTYLPDCSDRSLLAEFDRVRMTSTGASNILNFPQQIRCNVPALTLLCNDRDRLLIVSGEYAEKGFASVGMEGDSVTNREFKHS